jgi:hypothetical protein
MIQWLAAALAAAALLPAAALAEEPATPQDRQNAASACRALQTSMGTSFAQTYRNFGACISKWTQEQHQNRDAAEQACAAEPRRGGTFARCVAAKLRQESSADVQATRNAAKKCKAERNADAASFRAAYGGAANAFGKCVSKYAQQQDAEQEPATTPSSP